MNPNESLGSKDVTSDSMLAAQYHWYEPSENAKQHIYYSKRVQGADKDDFIARRNVHNQFILTLCISIAFLAQVCVMIWGVITGNSSLLSSTLLATTLATTLGLIRQLVQHFFSQSKNCSTSDWL